MAATIWSATCADALFTETGEKRVPTESFT
jgi:hypothetical protein